VSGFTRAALLLLVGANGIAQGNAQILPLATDRLEQPLDDARVGDWVEYRLDGGPMRQGHWRLAVVGEQQDARGRPAFWLEIEFGAHASLSAPLLQFRMLVAKGTGISSDGVSRLIVVFGHDRSREVDPLAIGRVLSGAAFPQPSPEGQNGHSASEAKSSVRRGKEVRLLTSAGAVSATPIELWSGQVLVQRFWVSAQVPVLHLARIELPAAAHSMEASGYGHDAKARIGEPDSTSPKIQLEQRVDAAGAP
jgi:hypothetical protein